MKRRIRYDFFLYIRHAMAEMELENWRREMKRRPQPAATTSASQGTIGNRLANQKRNRGIRHGYRTRAARDEEQEDDDVDVRDCLIHIKYLHTQIRAVDGGFTFTLLFSVQLELDWVKVS